MALSSFTVIGIAVGLILFHLNLRPHHFHGVFPLHFCARPEVSISSCILCLVQAKELEYAPFNTQLIGRMSQDDFRLVMRAFAEYRRDCDEEFKYGSLAFGCWPCTAGLSCIPMVYRGCTGKKASVRRALLSTIQEVNQRATPNGVSVTFVPEAPRMYPSLRFDVNQGVRPRR